jgi:hypothetical protein
MDRIRQFFGAQPEPEEEQGFLEELGEELTMTKTQRMVCVFLFIHSFTHSLIHSTCSSFNMSVVWGGESMDSTRS